ncbi:UDP-N-acetylmuramoyl-L-alanyl-D-glutamate--2,6-diaminopimelate ligase [Clostridium sp. FP1]|uniref:UDP-N-acetylmuramoyl-L-alanyl-D-glutamate--2, 6-diaminopimelate ligase n=1 Tax=Clostridium sp. FP1 TaxID=2724076 RepID=UPI001CCE95E9|nr:UDP-N-acetylmuramoyl-L-alanyl-D-glutamate--2,6-diaminopimelate ligase [Clostridium sp. FP1]MBZ9633444.1 UDP-N-acetylmuramoyl-L-alanyl-D-glutamate--2,6-diaminopimelate ligase [Clostridium sp. FP1]
MSSKYCSFEEDDLTGGNNVKLYEILKGVDHEILVGDLNLEVCSITWDSRNIDRNSLFIAVKNKNIDRHDFVLDAISNGSIALVVEYEIPNIPEDITVIKVKDARKSMAIIAKNYYENPTEKLKIIGVTGTNGKTSVSYFISEILQALQVKCGIIGTIENTVAGKKMKTKKLNPTTPDSIELQGSFAEMLCYGATHAVIEVTSSALSQDRVYGCKFDIGVFTNLTQDHLEEHGTMENYKNAKLKLFKMCKKGIINIDDAVAAYIMDNANCEIITYGIENDCDFRAINIKYTSSGVNFNLVHNNEIREVQLSIPGRFSVYNALAAIATVYWLGLNLDDIIKAVKEIKGVPGRFQAIPNSKGILTIVDYAHSPDGLENILTSVKEFAKGRIILVFGCGGNRDTGKRSIMGEIAGKYSDYCIITSDNPRKEEPKLIIDEIEVGMIKTSCSYQKIQDRRQAISKALGMAEAFDTVIIAGKGHENYQVLKDETIHFSDEEVVREYFF